MEFNFEKILKSPFVQKDWIIRLLPFAILTFFSGLLSLISNFSNSFTSSSSNNTSYFQNPIIILLGIIAMIFGLAYFVLSTFYFKGYFFKATKNIMNGDEINFLPDHKNIPEKIQLSLQLFGLHFILGLVPFILSLPILAVFIVEMISLISNDQLNGIDFFTQSGNLALLLGGAIYFLIFILISILFSIFIIPSAEFLLSQGNSLLDSISPSKIKAIIINHWIDILTGFGYSFLVSLCLLPVSFFIICFSFIATPVIETLTITWGAYIKGIIFSKILKKVIN